ncbi:MAG: hypothetical protein JNK37_06075 [Verrucomicrobiales bacterium]|nr:hypothetical protein [Verrucomicrobiales bacterium]
MELIVTIAVVAILASLAFPTVKGLKRRAEKAKCIGNMKSIFGGLNQFVLENNHWPQLPPGSEKWEEEDYFKWWIRQIEPYGIAPDVWLCASDEVNWEKGKSNLGAYSSYIPAEFNSHQYTPFRWNQPWLTERGDFHGKGAHVMMQDGSITTSQAPWGER